VIAVILPSRVDGKSSIIRGLVTTGLMAVLTWCDQMTD